MLSENIKAVRKSKGLSQQELAVKLNVVRQTISKWEQGLSVPDSEMRFTWDGRNKEISLLGGRAISFPMFSYANRSNHNQALN